MLDQIVVARRHKHHSQNDSDPSQDIRKNFNVYTRLDEGVKSDLGLCKDLRYVQHKNYGVLDQSCPQEGVVIEPMEKDPKDERGHTVCRRQELGS